MTPDVRDGADARLVRELRAVREIAHAFLVAERPVDVYQFALDRVTPILGAAFSLVMQVGDDGELLRPVAQHEWPAQHRNWIGALRVRIGDGPSGVALAERRLVEVPDLFADPSLASWYAVAEELGFRSIVAAPLIGANGPVGAIAFYFTDPAPVSDEQRALVRLVAEQLAATADKATLIDALRRANGALAEANEALEREARTADAARRARDQFLMAVTRRVSETLTAGDASVPQVHADPSGRATPSLMSVTDVPTMLAAARATALAAQELAAIECGESVPALMDVDPRTPLLEAVQGWRADLLSLRMTHGEPTVLLPTMRSDRAWLVRLLSLVIGQVIARHDGRDAIHVDVELGRGFVAHRLEWSGVSFPDLSQSVSALVDTPVDARGAVSGESVASHPRITALDVALLVAMIRRLGGSVQRDAPREDVTLQGITLVFGVDDIDP